MPNVGCSCAIGLVALAALTGCQSASNADLQAISSDITAAQDTYPSTALPEAQEACVSDRSRVKFGTVRGELHYSRAATHTIARAMANKGPKGVELARNIAAYASRGKGFQLYCYYDMTKDMAYLAGFWLLNGRVDGNVLNGMSSTVYARMTGQSPTKVILVGG